MNTPSLSSAAFAADHAPETETPASRREIVRAPPPPPPAPPVLVILGLPFHNVSFADTLEWVRRRVLSRQPVYIATANMDFVTQAWRDPELQRILLEADLVVADGMPIVWLSRVLGPPLKERVTGSDLVPLIAGLAAREGFSLYGLGGAEGVADRALNLLRERHPGLRIAGTCSPPKAGILDMDHDGILARLAQAGPDILLVAFGAPKQEKWCNMHIRRWRVPVSIGVGGSLDFIAGVQKRAPGWVRRLALEWLWRMLSDPRRLFRRYVDNAVFLFAAVFRLSWLRWGPVPEAGRRPAAGAEPAAAADAEGVRRIRFSDWVAGRAGTSTPSGGATDADLPLVVDLGGRDWLDSRSLGELLALNRSRRDAGRWLCLLVPSPRLGNLLRFVRLDRYIPVAADMPEALRLLGCWNGGGRAGRVRIDPERRLHIVLPVELNAATMPGFRTEVDSAWQTRADGGEWSGVSVDASRVTFLDSAGVGYLVALRKRALALPGGFRCAGFRGNARRTLVIARLERLFDDAAPGAGGAA